MDRGAWWATVYGVAKSWTRLSDKHTHTHKHKHTHTHLSRCSKGLHSIFDEPVFDKNSRNTGVNFSFSSLVSRNMLYDFSLFTFIVIYFKVEHIVFSFH